MVTRFLGLLTAAMVLTTACSAPPGPQLSSEPEPAPTPTSVPTATPAPTATPIPTPTPQPSQCAAQMPLRDRLSTLLMPLVTQADLPEVAALVVEHGLGGIVVLGSPNADITEQLAEIQQAAPRPLIVATDEEGGSVQRLAALLGPIASARSLATSGSDADAAIVHEIHGVAMAELGFTMSLAPVVDVGAGPGIGDRSFGDDAETVVSYAGAVAGALRDAGLTPVLKHFPGHGRASADSHAGLPTTPHIDELREVDLVPYRELLGQPGIAAMVGHLNVPGLTDGSPASLSPLAIDGLLRGEVGFDGLVLTDALNMGAITQQWSIAEAAELALRAGADLVMIDSIANVPEVVVHLEQAVLAGTLSNESINTSVVRVLNDRRVDPCLL